MFRKSLILLYTLTIAALLLAACGGAGGADEGGRLKVVATTTILGDVAAQVGGEHIALNVLLPTGTDPHGFEPSPQDAAAIAEADLVLINGFGLEEFIAGLLENAGGDAHLVTASEGIEPLEFAGEHHHGAEDHAEGEEHEDHDEGEEHEDHEEGEEHEDHEEGEEHEDHEEGEEHEDHDEGEEHEHEEGEEHEHGGADPHVWMDPHHIITWTENIAAALSDLDPDNAASYRANADAYIEELEELDAWAQQQVENLEPSQRILVTDHDSFSYLAAAYDFEVVGTIIPSFSTQSSPSAGELAELQTEIEENNVPAIFVGTTVNSELADQMGADLGVEIVPLYTGSLSDADGPASTYLDFIRYNVTAIVEALGGSR